jgi:hypothetical protein
MVKLWMALKAVGYICLAVFSIYAIFLSGNKNLGWWAILAWMPSVYMWWRKDREALKSRDERKFQRLIDRITYLERKMREIDAQHLELEQRLQEIERSR